MAVESGKACNLRAVVIVRVWHMGRAWNVRGCGGCSGVICEGNFYVQSCIFRLLVNLGKSVFML